MFTFDLCSCFSLEKEKELSYILLFTNVSYIMLTADGTFFFPNSAVFNGASAFNGDISKWDVSGVTDMTDSTWNDSSIVYF